MWDSQYGKCYHGVPNKDKCPQCEHIIIALDDAKKEVLEAAMEAHQSTTRLRVACEILATLQKEQP